MMAALYPYTDDLARFPPQRPGNGTAGNVGSQRKLSGR
jgi:hypothetical protein